MDWEKDDKKTEKFMERYQLVKSWFEAESLEVSDFVLGRMASRLGDFTPKSEILEAIKALTPKDEEAKGWEILESGEAKSCCPGDDAGFGYNTALNDLKAKLNLQ